MKVISLFILLFLTTLKIFAQTDDLQAISLENIEKISLLDAIHCPQQAFDMYRSIELAVSGNQLLAVKGCDGDFSKIKIYDISTHTFIDEVDAQRHSICQLIDISYDGRLLACYDISNSPTHLTIYSVETNEVILQYVSSVTISITDSYHFYQVVFSPDNSYAYGIISARSTSEFYNMVQVWNLETGEALELVSADDLPNLYPLPNNVKGSLELHANYNYDTQIQIMDIRNTNTQETYSWFFSSDWEYVMGSSWEYGYEPIGEAIFSRDATTIALSIPHFILIFGIPNESRPAFSQIPAYVYPSSIQVRANPDLASEPIGILEEGRVLVDGRSSDNEFLHVRDIGWVITEYLNLGEIAIDALKIK